MFFLCLSWQSDKQCPESKLPHQYASNAVPQCARYHKKAGDEKSESPNDFVNRNSSENDLSSQSKFLSSLDFKFVSSTDPSEEGLSEPEVMKRTDPDLLALFQDPSLSWRTYTSCGDKQPVSLSIRS